jgi:hypothetical protein
MRQMEFRRVRRRWPGVTSQLLYMTCRAFMRRNEDLPGVGSPFSDRHPEARAQRASKDERPPNSRRHTGPSPFEALASLGHLRVTDSSPCSVSVWHSSDPHSLHRYIMFRFFHRHITSRFRAALGARINLVSLCRPPNEGGGGAPQGAHWVFDHAGEARCRVNGTRRSRCDRDRAPRRSTVAISGRGTTLQLRQCPPDPRCDLPAGPIARPGRLGPVPPAPGFASTSHGTPRLAPSVGSSPETPLMSENESGVA